MLRQGVGRWAQLRKLALVAIVAWAVRSAFRKARIATGWSVTPSCVRSGGGSAHGWSGITIDGPRVRNATLPRTMTETATPARTQRLRRESFMPHKDGA